MKYGSIKKSYFQLALVVPISKQIKGYAVEVVLPAKNKVQGVILTNQVNSIDWKARQDLLID